VKDERGVPAVTLPVAISEETVHRLCGPEVFAAADAFQRDGHVLSPKVATDGLSANVRGVWQRVDQVTVQARAGRLHPDCSRDGAAFCRHVGAVLLQWLRDPASFAEILPPDEEDELLPAAARPVVAAQQAEDETPQAELARLLDRDTVSHLREIGTRRGVRPPGTRKADVVRHLATALADAAGIEAALAALSAGQRKALDAIVLASTEGPAQSAAISEAYRALGGRGEPPLDTLLEAALVFSPNLNTYSIPVYTVPRAVVACLPTLPDLARPVAAPDRNGTPWLGIVELLQVVALEARETPLATDVGGNDGVRPELASFVPAGFAVDPTDAASANPVGFTMRYAPMRLRARPLLAAAPLTRLAERIGQSRQAVEFAVRLMLALDIAELTPQVVVRPDRLQALLDLEPAARLRRLVQAWLANTGAFELGMLIAPGGRLRLRWNPTYGDWAPLPQAIASVARLVVGLLGRLPPAAWYDLSSFVETVERLTAASPVLARLRAHPPSSQALSLGWIGNRSKEEPLALRPPEGWSRFLSVLVPALLSGPLTWLGLVDVVAGADRGGALRARPAAAGVLAGREAAAESPASGGRLVVGEDLTVLVPAPTTDVAIHGQLARAGELVAASAEGLRYRLTPAGMQALFDAGTTGPEFARFLAERAGGTLPPAVSAALDRWWSGYGAIRLYDELALIEFRDDVLLSELRAATTLDSALIHVFSPRLVAVDAGKADELVAELTARGYTPRLVEAG